MTAFLSRLVVQEGQRADLKEASVDSVSFNSTCEGEGNV